MHRTAFAIIALMAIGVSGSQSTAGDWPGWRGPQGDGVVRDANVPLKWSAGTAAWKTKIPGVGYSSPIIKGDRIFLTSSGVDKPTDRCLICVDRKTGKIEWAKEVFDSPIEKMHRLNSPASSTPACDDQRVYVVFAENGHVGVAAFDFDGKLLWKKRPGEFISRHGMHSCPVVRDGKLIVNGEQDGDDSFVAALDGETGDTLWKVERPNKVRSFAAPFLLQTKGRTQVAVSGASQTIAYDIADGSEIWRVNGPASKTVSSMLTDGELLFVPGGREDLMLAVDPNGKGEVTESHIVWKGKKGIPYVPSPVLANNILHVVSDDGVYTSYDPKTGRIIKQLRAAGHTSSSLVVVRDRVLLTEDSGITHVLESDGSGKELARNDVGETVYASLSVSDGALFIRTVENLLCFQRESSSFTDPASE